MAAFNRVIMVGNLTRDPELRAVGSGQVCRLGIATNRSFKNKTGALTQEVCFIDVDVWGPQAESCNQYLKKGRPVLVEGRLKFDTWKEADGVTTRSKHSIVADRVVFMGTAQASEGAQDAADDYQESSAQNVSGARRVSEQKPETNSSMGGTALFKDEPPFQDDLPF